MNYVTTATQRKHAQNFTPTCLSVFVALLGASPLALAQVAPDAGRVLQQQAPTLEAPKLSPDLKLSVPEAAPVETGGAKVTPTAIKIEGGTLFSEEVLLGALGDVTNQAYDLAGLRGLTNRLSDFYHAHGYPFARAYLPPQAMKGGVLLIEVVEGRYGKVEATGTGDDEGLALKASPFLASLKPGEVIESKALERATLLLDDLPGIKAAPAMRPGSEPGTGDLVVNVQRTEKYAGEVGFDNQGNRYTGQNRARFNLDVNSPFMLGDQITLRSLITEQGMWFGNVGYSVPLGGDGLRASIGYGHTYYELGKEFSALSANGTADVANLGLSYPIIRSQQTNLSVTGTWLHKRLHDRQDVAGTDTSKSSDSLPIGLNFDTRDGLGGGAITYGNVTWTAGKLHLDSGLSATDSTTAQTAGDFNKANLDVARLQTVTQSTTLYARFSGQWANKNLDSSEQFGLGGPNGVRAYPVGESYGAEGWLTQLEMRYALGQFSPYAFYDSGWIKTNINTWTAGSNERSLSGYGIGLRYSAGRWNADAALAWRNHGGAPQSDTKNDQPVGWFNVGMKF